MVFFALQDYIGEGKLNGAIKAFLDKARYQIRPYTNTAEFVSYLKKATPDSLQYVVHDMFETITLFENQLDEATYTLRPDGKYDVRLTLHAAKLRADSLGNENPHQAGRLRGHRHLRPRPGQENRRLRRQRQAAISPESKANPTPNRAHLCGS